MEWSRALTPPTTFTVRNYLGQLLWRVILYNIYSENPWAGPPNFVVSSVYDLALPGILEGSMINDKPSDPATENELTREPDRLRDEVLQRSNGVYEQVRAVAPDPHASRVLETSGVLPGIELSELGAVSHAQMDNLPSGVESIAPSKLTDITGTQSDSHHYFLAGGDSSGSGDGSVLATGGDTSADDLIARRDALLEARQLKHAIENGDGAQVVKMLEEMTDEQLLRLKGAYGLKLEDDLREHLSGKELEKALELVERVETEDEKLLARRDALMQVRQLSREIENGDGAGVVKLLEGMTERQLERLKAAYGEKLEDDLKQHLSGKELETALMLVERVETEDEKLLARRDALLQARELSQDIENGDGDRVVKLLEGMTERQLERLKKAYGDKLEDDLKQHLSGEKLDKAIDLLHGVKTRTLADGSVKEDPNGNVVYAIGQDARPRKFHYDESGNLDQIDGHLGHWQRTVDKQGREAWVDKDTGTVWDGKMRVDSAGNLHYQPYEGQSWTFTRNGKGVRKA